MTSTTASSSDWWRWACCSAAPAAPPTRTTPTTCSARRTRSPSRRWSTCARSPGGCIRPPWPTVASARRSKGWRSGPACPLRLRYGLVERLDVATETVAYFVVSEAVTNALKHGDATGIDIDVIRQGGGLAVSVTDDGIGGAQPAGTGLSGLARRVAAADGEFMWTVRPAARPWCGRGCRAGDPGGGLDAAARGPVAAAGRGGARRGGVGRRRRRAAGGHRARPAGRGGHRRPDAAHPHRRGPARGVGDPEALAGGRRARAVPVRGEALRCRADQRRRRSGRLPAEGPGGAGGGVPRRAGQGRGGRRGVRPGGGAPAAGAGPPTSTR